ncbi:IS982 family transposase [Hymenobacter sp. PAMC 26628]|uniref:IS982 family transposase n=1 Tax=Hymenobacter sp. PAMC 26628 TaxID=1484118 RepID=UPI000770416A|nr:IS982 family transposase [Hymenobacter sp. PAMC 26628]AMJ67936.1 hypothetical protein AXW84_22835 [Hymenobacter sp. PAMC 26628]
MREQTVAMYCLLDDIIRFTHPANTLPATGSRRLRDAQVLTTALVATRFFGGNLVMAKHYMAQHWGQNRLDKNGFTRRLHALADALHALFALVGDWFKQRHPEARHVLDSFPVAVCHNTRIPRGKLLTGKAYHGRCASKRSWFYGLKVPVVATSTGVPVEFHLPAGGESKQAGRRGLSLDLPEGSVLYTDAGYTDYVTEDLFNEASGSQQQTARGKNSKRPHHPAQSFLIQYLRKSIETTFSQLTARFPKQIHAVTAQGFALKIALFIFAHTLHQAGL